MVSFAMSGCTMAIWRSLRGNIFYLGIFGILVLVFLILPYTLCLIFFQQLQACSGHKMFRWVNKLKPVFDAYAGPYKDKYRFWTGMLLGVRTLLIILFTTNTTGSIDRNLLFILVASSLLLVANTHGAYSNWVYNYLESFFYLQLGVFAGGVLYAKNDRATIMALANTSIGITLILFLAVIAYHIWCCTKTYHYRWKGYVVEVDEDVALLPREEN